LQKLKNLLAHKNFEGRLDKLVDLMADMALKKLDPKAATAERSRSVVAVPVVAQRLDKKRSRYIPSKIKREVWKRARNQCESVSPVTGMRCSCTHGLQIDHILEFSKGGSNDPENLQLLCGAHNRWKSGVNRFKSAERRAH
jgi:hypothetical protein